MQIIDDLQYTRARTLNYFETGDADLDRTYGPGKWLVRFILHHLADAETVLYERIRRAIAEPGQVVWAFDPDAWAAGLDYDIKSLDLSRAIYAACREGVIYLAGRFYETKGHHTLVHSQAGLRTLKDVFDKVVRHNERHLTQIEEALGKTAAGSRV